MKITMFIGSIRGGGAERVLCNLANYLVSNNHDVTILTMSDAKSTYSLNDEIKRVSLLHSNERGVFLSNSLKRYFRLKKYIKSHDSDTYLVMLPITTILLLSFRKLIKGPIIAAERNDPASYNVFYRFLLKSLALNADAWVFQTNKAMNWYGTKLQKKTIIPNAINSEFIKKEIFDGNREKTIVAVGRLTTQKNFSLLIDSFSEISKEFPDYKLLIYGTGPKENELKAMVKELSLENKVEFCGFVENIGSKIDKASLFVLSSNFEGMPNSLMEALALGIPCVATNCPCGGPEYLIDNYENGILVPVNDKKALVEAISIILHSVELQLKFSVNGHKIIERLDPSIIYNNWEKYIEDVQHAYEANNT